MYKDIMDFFETERFLKKKYPGKLKNLEFDEECYRHCAFVLTEGSPNLVSHIECDRVKASIEGMMDQYISISPCRICI